MRRIDYKSMIAGAFVALLSLAATTAYGVDSSLGRFQAYADPLYDSYGNKIGITVRYSLGELMDQSGQPSHYSAVCMNDGWSGAPCVTYDQDADARTWTSTYSPYVGYWMTRNIHMNCSSSTKVKVTALQPYTYYGSTLNFYRNDQPPRKPNNDLFYSGSGDSANLLIQGCEQMN